jgi:hypothetical protein
VGRDRELHELHQLLRRGDRVAIAAVGMGGIGKTRLARQYVARHRHEYPGGIWWVAAAQVATEIVTYAQRSLGLEAQQLCQWLGYLPLGIELVGRYLAETGTIAGVLAQLRAKSLAAEPIASMPDEADYGRNVRAAIALSWEKLDAAGQRALSFLAEFALAPIRLAWVEAGLESAETEGEEAGEAGSVQAVLDRQLVKRSLLNRSGTDYLLHSLVREFVRGQGRDASLGSGLLR